MIAVTAISEYNTVCVVAVVSHGGSFFIEYNVPSFYDPPYDYE